MEWGIVDASEIHGKYNWDPKQGEFVHIDGIRPNITLLEYKYSTSLFQSDSLAKVRAKEYIINGKKIDKLRGVQEMNAEFYEDVTITKDGVVVFGKRRQEVILQQNGPICWMHTILNSILLSDRMRVIFAEKLLNYLQSYKGDIESLMDGKVASIPYLANTAETTKYVFYKFIYVYLYHYFKINTTTKINPHTTIEKEDAHILERSYNGYGYPALLARVLLLSDDSVCSRALYYEKNHLKGALPNVQIINLLSKVDAPVAGTESIITRFDSYFVRTYKVAYSKDIHETMEEYSIESAGILIDDDKETAIAGLRHIITGYKRNGKYYIVDSNRPESIIECNWYLKTDREACINQYYKSPGKINVSFAIFVNTKAPLITNATITSKLKSFINNQVTIRKQLMQQNLLGGSSKHKHKGQIYKVHKGARGGSYITVGPMKTKVYIKSAT